MEREERRAIAGEALDGEDFATFVTPGSLIPDPTPMPAPPVPARLWHECMDRWIGRSHRGQAINMAASVRRGPDAPPVRPPLGALILSNAGHMEPFGIAGGASVTDCTTGGATCAPIS